MWLFGLLYALPLWVECSDPFLGSNFWEWMMSEKHNRANAGGALWARATYVIEEVVLKESPNTQTSRPWESQQAFPSLRQGQSWSFWEPNPNQETGAETFGVGSTRPFTIPKGVTVPNQWERSTRINRAVFEPGGRGGVWLVVPTGLEVHRELSRISTFCGRLTRTNRQHKRDLIL